MSSDDTNAVLEKAKFLWDEYKYRHELIWKIIFQTTTAVVVVCVVPFAKEEIAKAVTYWMLALPILGVVLTVLSMARTKKELDILDAIRMRHREFHKILYGIEYRQAPTTFSRDVIRYLWGLFLLCVADMIAIGLFWIPTF